LSDEPGGPVIAIDAEEFPALARMVRQADDVDGYLRSLGLSDADIAAMDGHTPVTQAEGWAEGEADGPAEASQEPW
jgi:hypothetical protein